MPLCTALTSVICLEIINASARQVNAIGDILVFNLSLHCLSNPSHPLAKRQDSVTTGTSSTGWWSAYVSRVNRLIISELDLLEFSWILSNFRSLPTRAAYMYILHAVGPNKSTTWAIFPEPAWVQSTDRPTPALLSPNHTKT